jgi:biotin carboxyl carrier protein
MNGLNTDAKRIYRVIVGGRTFEVEIQNLNTSPVVAIVDGEPVEVWLQDSTHSTPAPGASRPIPNSQPAEMPASMAANLVSGDGNRDANSVKAPIPGVIVTVCVQPGDEVHNGQELCVLEAMKMKNTIRSPRSGKLAKVLVAAGQTVNHHDPLFEFEQQETGP